MAIIAEFDRSQADLVAELILSIQQREFGLPISLDAQPDLSDIDTFYRTGAGNFRVALDGEHVVGTIALLDIGEGRAALRKMFVHPAYRGSAHGVAQELLDTLLAWCRSHALREIWLGTTSRFLAAHRFYEKNRFEEVAVDALPMSFPVMKIDSRFYRRAV